MPPKLLIAILALLWAGCTRPPPLTPVSAGELAARLANERCYRMYGARPFQGEDYEAILEAGRWNWGAPEGGPVDGYVVEVSFARNGQARQVRLNLKGEEPE